MIKHKTTGIFIAVAVISLIQIILVLLVDCAMMATTSRYESLYSFLPNTKLDGVLGNAVYLFYAHDSQDALMAWSITHMVLHVAWLASTFILIAFAIKPEPKKKGQVLQFAIITILVCMVDLGACIHSSVINAEVYLEDDMVGIKLFFPMFYIKAGVFWVFNVAASIVIFDIINKMRAELRNAASQEQLSHHTPMATAARDNPAVMAPVRHDLVDNFYNHQPSTTQSHEHLQPPPEPYREIHKPKDYKSPEYRPPYYDEYVQRSSLLATPKFEVPVPQPDY